MVGNRCSLLTSINKFGLLKAHMIRRNPKTVNQIFTLSWIMNIGAGAASAFKAEKFGIGEFT
jgi:hypothetical protein